MEFGSPHLLHLIWLVPLFAGLGVIGAGLRSRRLRRWADESLWVPLAPGRSRWRRGVRLSLALIALGFAVLAAARPQVAARLVQVDRQGIEVVVLLDTSLSMEANDVVPSRLERSKLEIRELMDGLEGDKIGLVIFAGTAFPLCPLTADVAGANLFLDAVEVDLLPDPGTNLEAALRGALDMLTRSESTTASAAVVLFSDGESHDGDPFPILEEYNEVGIPILTVGVGTPGGEPIPLRDERGTLSGYKKDRSGEVVLSRLDETTLGALAERTGGQYFPATLQGREVGDMLSYFERLERGELGGGIRRRVEERFQVPAGLGALFLLMALLVPEGRRQRDVV